MRQKTLCLPSCSVYLHSLPLGLWIFKSCTSGYLFLNIDYRHHYAQAVFDSYRSYNILLGSVDNRHCAVLRGVSRKCFDPFLIGDHLNRFSLHVQIFA